ncbi:hypothetical protein [sulfur-oxidizing endosymbiont of Gigantopelta aegis]|uniref:hypothetical protein n=3 Tax=sulfur-oxidizing endosymbiont of Gigantopelta aegis TaxID=2794934 RepID=UPI001FE75B18|nr:hypothetical protein [sulfur-oxidizing endosymbiont of Gigantopelta aegis]
MDKISSDIKQPRIPVEINDIQVNFCKNPLCQNYGVPASTESQVKLHKSQKDCYKLSSGSRKPVTKLICKSCNELFPVKSNQGIWDELQRIEEYLKETPEVSCPDNSCKNNLISIKLGKEFYQSFGKTKSGSSRYRCKSCKKTFSVKQSTTGQKQPHKNNLIFKLLMNKSPLRRICEVADVGMATVYAKIDFLHKQCMTFVSEREQRLIKSNIKRLYVSVDRQEYIVNWTRREDKRNIKLSAIGSADNETGYVFQMNLNYDPCISPIEIEENALSVNDYNAQYAYRKHARFWLNGDYKESVKNSRSKRQMDHL